jgi:internalin A
VFHREGLFGGQIVVDQSWALEAIYTIFTRQEELQRSIDSRRGRFTRDDLDRYVWKGKFNIQEQRLFLSMMEQCHICFQVRDGEYIAPEKLEPWTQDHAANYAYLLNRPADAAVVATYHFLHIGIVRSFLAQIGHEAQERGEFWRYGCCFYERNTGSRALIQCHPGRPADGEQAGTISLQAWGTNARELLASLVTMLNQMPLGQRPAITWTAGDSPLPDTDEGRARFQRHITLPRQVFLSYRHGDSADLVCDLANVLRREGWDVIWDHTHLAHGDSISTFVEQVRLIPFLIPVWSRTYHDSRWCLSELFGWLEGQQCRFERLSERAIGLILDDVSIDQPEHRSEHTTRLRTWCQGRARRADSLAPRDLELLQLMQAWHPRFSRVLERLSDTLLPRGEAALRQDNFRTVVQRLNALYDEATS